MNYETLYETLQPQHKSLKESLASLQKLSKTVTRETEGGEIRNLLKDLDTMAENAAALSSILETMKNYVSEFDTKTYFESGDFERQMLDACREKGVDVQGSSPVYEMFPYRVKLDMENQDVYLDRKKYQCMRPKSFVDMVQKSQEKLNKAAFNPSSFAGELADAYDTAVLKLKRRSGADIYLSSLHKYLAPMSRFRKDYDQQSFAFDLARLYISGIEETKTGRRFQFGTSRDCSKPIRILDENGKEQFLSTICFYDQEG